MLIMASIWYLAMTSILTVGQYYLERHYQRGSGFSGPDQTLPGRLWHAIRYIRPGNEQAALLSTGSEHQR
jgi:polar amino acid transport system permease protein